ncbi:MAG: Mth938-like domain-containing protein [Pseudomonadota bacterium]
MDITPAIPKNRNVINGYGIEGFKINETLYHNSIILTSNQIIEVKINSLADFFEQDLKIIFDFQPEILLIGTGNHHKIISSDLKNKIKTYYPEIAIDEMNTGSACRTYNILMMEDRNVAVFLMPIL